MERQSTSKLFKIVIAIVAFFVLCSSALLFASCGVSKDDGHEHVYPETPNATVPATCGTPGYIVYECTECGEQFKVEISLATGKHTFNENDVCTNCGMTKTQADLLTQAAFKSAIDDLKNTLGTLATGAQLQGLNDLSQAQVKTLTDALETALKAAITNAQTAITEAVGGSTSGTSSAKTEILQAIQDALEDINGEDATSVQSVLKAEIAKQTAKIEEYNTKLDGLKASLEAAQGEAKDAIIEEINKTNEAIESAKDAIVAAVSAAQTSIEGKLDDLDEKVGTAQTTLSGEIGNVKTVVDGIQEALKALDNLAKTTDVAEVKTLVEEIKTTLTTTITGRFDSIDSAIAALTNSESGIAASVKSNTQTQLDALKSELKTLIETGTSDDKFDEVVSQITQKITDAFNSFKQTLETTLDDKLAGILTQSHFDTELQKVTATLGEIKTKVNEALDKKLSEVEGSIGTAQKAILDAIAKMAGSEEEGEGPVLPTIKGWVQEILYAITGDSQYAPAAASSLMSESVKPEGMQKQIADLWDKADELQDALATLSESLTTLSGSVSNLPNKTEVQGYITALQEELKGKQDTYNTNLTTLNGTLSSVSTKVDNVQSYLEDTLYKQLEAMDEKLDTLVQNMGEFYTLFTKLREYAQKHYADLGGKTWEEVFDNVLKTFGGYFQQLPSYLNKLKGWDDIIDKIVEFAKAQGVVNEDGTLGTNFNKAIDTVKALWDFLGVSEQLDDKGNYKNDGAITTVATLVGMLDGLQTTADDIKNAVDGLVTKFDSLDVSALMQAVKAFNGSNEAGEKVKGVVELLKDLPEEIKSAFINALSSADIKNAVKGLLETYFPGHTASELKVLAQDYVEIAEELRDIWKAFGDNAGDNLKTLVQWAATNYVNGNMSALLDSAKGLQQLVDSKNGIQATVKAFEQSMNKTLGTFDEGKTVQSMLDDILDKLGALGTAQGAHQHHWVKRLAEEADDAWKVAENQTPNCLESNTYVWSCNICGELEKKGEAVVTDVVLPTGHVISWTYFGADNAEFDSEDETFDEEHDQVQTTYYAPTCVNFGRVEGYCVVCGQPTGEWTTVGAPTGIHNYVLETAHKAEGEGCTFVHDYVYHCTTCGGAYTEKVTGEGFFDPDAVHGSEKTPHNYYTLTIEEQNDLFDAYVEKYNEENSDETITVKDLTAQQKYAALEPYLNKVWDHEPTCVEPSLTVVECTVCGVRYAYSGLEPLGHKFEIVSLGTQNTCTMDGSAPYFKCKTCGYFFKYDGPAKTALSPVEQKTTITEDDFKAWAAERTNLFSKNYAKDAAGNVLTDEKAAAEYFTGSLKATGHDYVKVYTNVPNCVTAATYVLICQTCFEVNGKSFDELVLKEDKSNGTEAKFEKVPAEKVTAGYYADDAYTVRGLSESDHNASKTVVDSLLNDNGSTGEPKDGKSTLSLKYDELTAEGADVNDLLDFLAEYGYITDEEKDAFVEAGTTVEDIKALNLYTAQNFLERDSFKDAVHGHTFNETLVTIEGNCVMYERHVYFCGICGQNVKEKEYGNSKSCLVVGNKDVDSLKNGDNDLADAWAAVKGDETAAIAFLTEKGYFIDQETYLDEGEELKDVLTAEYEAYNTANGTEYTLLTYLDQVVFGKNTLPEYTVTKDKAADGTISDHKLGHTFDTVMLLDAESCNEPGYYVYVCSKCGFKKATAAGKLPTLTYQSGSETVDTGKALLSDTNYNVQSDNKAHNNVVPEERRKNNSKFDANYGPAIGGGNTHNNDDLEREWNSVATKEASEEDIFDWLLEKGYLNNVIDTYVTVGYTDEDSKLHGGFLYKGEEVDAVNVTTEDYQAAFAQLKVDENDIPNDAAQKAEILTLAKKLIAEAAEENDQITEGLRTYYYRTGIVEQYWKNTHPEFNSDKEQWNKTISETATIIPQSGHLFTKENGELLNKVVDPLCKDFGNGDLNTWYKAGYYANWVDDEPLEDGTPQGHWEKGDKIPEDELAKLDPTFKAAADAYGIIAACKRGKNCPLHTSAEAAKSGEPFTAGYVAATDHVMSYEKYQSVADGKGHMIPSNKVIGEGDGNEHVFYNMKTVEDYKTEEIAKDYLVDGNWKGASDEEKTAAAQLAMDADALNLYTLQKIYNLQTLTKLGYLDQDGKYIDGKKVENITYPAEEDIYPANGKLVTGDDAITVDWQPLTRDNKPSCWISLRCNWYHYERTDEQGEYIDGYDGTLCTKKEADNAHTYPKDGEWTYQANAANCQHGNLCIICGKEIGKIGEHKFVNVKEITDVDYLAAYNALKEEAEWATPLVPTCSETGTEVYVCTGELEVYAKNHDVSIWQQNVNYRIEEVATIPHTYTTYYYDAVTNQHYSESEWNAFSDILCLHGYYTQDVCEALKRDGTTYCHHVRQDVKPTEDQLAEEGWKAYYTAKQIIMIEKYEGVVGKTISKSSKYVPMLADEEAWLGYSYFVKALETVPAEKTLAEMTADEFKAWLDDAVTKGALTKNNLFTIMNLNGLNSFGSDYAWIDPENVISVTGNGVYPENAKTTYRVVNEAAKNHTLAPVEDYWLITDKFEKATKTNNARMQQVCVICGEVFYEEYGASVSSDGEQYNMATGAQIKAWNAYNTDPAKKAREEGVRLEDLKNEDLADDAGQPTDPDSVLPEGNFTLEEELTVELGNSTTKETVNESPEDRNGNKFFYFETKLHSKTRFDLQGQTLTFNKLAEANEDVKQVLKVWGDLEIVDGTFDTDLYSIEVMDGSTLTLDGVTFTSEESAIVPVNGGTVIIKNSTLKTTDTPLQTNNTAITARHPVNIVIEGSQLISEEGAGLLINNQYITLTATDSVFFGKNMGAFVRSGNATFTDCTFLTQQGQKGSAWADGTQTDVSAALVVGNKLDTLNYGNATVTLNNCDFGLDTYENVVSEVEGAALGETPCSGEDYALAIYSCTGAKFTNSAFVTVDPATDGNVANNLHKEGPASTYECLATIAALGENPAEAAAELVAEFVAKDGVLVLPDGLGTITVAEESPLTVAGKTELDLGDNTLEATKGFIVSATGDLRIEGGTIEAGTNGTSQAFAVKEGGKVTLTGTELTLTDCMEGASTYGIYGEANTAITVAESTIYNNYGPAIGTNAHQGPVTLVLTDSSFFSDMPLGKEGKNSTDSTSVGLLLNNKDSELFAGGCLFYGTNAAAWIRGGKAMFAGCTFVSGGVVRENAQWYSGAGFKGEAQAAVVIGNGNDTTYGDVEVEIIDCEVSFTTVDAETAPKTPEALATTSLEKIPEETTKDYNKNTWTLPASKGETGKTMAIAAVDTTKTTVSFSDEATATKFIGTELKKGDNVFMYGGANIGNFNVSYQKEVPPTEEGGDPTYETVKIDITVETTANDASTDLAAAAENGGKIVLPEGEEALDVTVDQKVFQVGEDKALEVDLNGNNLKLTGDGTHSAILAKEGGEVTINGNGGTLEVTDSSKAPIGANGEGSKLTIKNTTLKTNVSLQGENGATVVLEDTKLISSSAMAISTNNTLQPVHYEIRDCKIASYSVGNVALLINGDKVTLEAENTEFYGTCTGVWVRAAEKATFTGCTFISGSAVTSNQTWGEGTSNPADAKAALLIGDGAGNYGDVKDVTIGEDCHAFITYEWYSDRGQTTHNDTAITSAENDLIEEEEGWFKFKPYTGEFKNKVLVIAESGTQKANVKFANAEVAKEFEIEGQNSLVKDTNVYLEKGATAMQIVVTIGDADPFSPKAE